MLVEGSGQGRVWLKAGPKLVAMAKGMSEDGGLLFFSLNILRILFFPKPDTSSGLRLHT
jgi:hypothetical protein